MDEPELRQKIENRGANFEEIIALTSQANQMSESITTLHRTDEQAMGKLRELIVRR
jgi:hypothetical protein